MTQISVLVPVYNTSQYLRECLDSIMQQTFKDIEIICVNDCSTDNSQNILEEYAKKDSRIKVYINDVNVGLSITRNVLLSKATAPFIMWCDSDDYYMPNICSTMYFHINEQNVDMVEFNLYDDKNKLISNLNNYGKHGITPLINYTHSTMWNKIYKKELIDKYNVQFPNARTTEDIPFNTMYMMVAKQIYYCHDVLYFYRYNTKSIVNTYNNNRIESIYKTTLVNQFFEHFQYIFDFAKKNSLLTQYKTKLIKLLLVVSSKFFIRQTKNYTEALIKINALLSQLDYTNATDNLSSSEQRLLKMIVNNESSKIKKKFHPSWLKRNIKIKLSLRNKELYIKLGKFKLSFSYN